MPATVLNSLSGDSVEAMEKWKSNAQKAVEADKAPSKSALKKQQGKMAPKKNKKVKG
jgi:hypothetical protein